MSARQEFEFAEVLVDKLFLESFPNERSAYYAALSETERREALDRFRSRVHWHIGHSLSRRQKEVIKLYLQGKTEREIAQILGITQQVVHTYKHRAINKLRKIIAK